jgi:hypothetical protein
MHFLFATQTTITIVFSLYHSLQIQVPAKKLNDRQGGLRRQADCFFFIAA